MVGNPLYDWTHLELRRYFGIDQLLSPDTASTIYATCNEQLKDASFSARNLLRRMNVKTVCTTDDPIDDLSFHSQLKRDEFEISVLPTFRPDKAMAVEDPVAYNRYLADLEKASRMHIGSFEELLVALDNRHAYFHDNGCRSSDHGFETLSADFVSNAEADALLATVRTGKQISGAEASKFKAKLLLELFRMNHHRGWVQQMHFGIIRNARERIYRALGPDIGVDCVGDFSFGRPLCTMLDALDVRQQLTKTIFFNAHLGSNEMLATIIGAFQDGTTPGKIQLGPPWWFLDQKDGFMRHFNAISSIGLLSRFVGMTTDSRSLLSFPRHEYFRRLLCDFLGCQMENGDLPNDMELIGGIVQDLCFTNAKKYFGY